MNYDLNKELLKILPFYNSFIDAPEIKKLSKVVNELKITKINNVFSGYARAYKIEIVGKRDVVVQLKSSEISLKKLFKDLLIELKGFKYQITLKVILSKVKSSDEIEYNSVYFNSLTKTAINDNFKSNEYFSEIIYRLENWISHGSGWVVEEFVNEHLNIRFYLPLSRSTYIKLPKELSHPMKGLINFENDGNKCFLWCHVRHSNLSGNNLRRITRKDRELSRNVNYSNVDYSKLESLACICINVFCYENKVVYPVYLSDKTFNDSMDLLLISNEFTNHYVYIKDFNRLMFNKPKNKNKKYFCKSCLQCFSSEKVLIEHKKDCLLINKRQNVRLEKGFIEFKNFKKMIPAPFKIYADFECLLKSVDCGVNNDCFSPSSKYQGHILCSFVYKLVCIDNKFSKDVVLYRGKKILF